MTVFYNIIICVLILTLALGFIRVVKGPTSTDRMLSTQLLGTICVAILIVLSVSNQNEILLNIALTLALLSPISLIAYIHIKKAKD